jgi:hypothetical protein
MTTAPDPTTLVTPDPPADTDGVPGETLAALRAKYGEGGVAVCNVAGETVVMRKPRRVEMKEYRAQIYSQKGQKVADAMESLLHSCCAYPEGEAARSALLDRKPGIIDTCATAALELAGFTGESETKKY